MIYVQLKGKVNTSWVPTSVKNIFVFYVSGLLSKESIFSMFENGFKGNHLVPFSKGIL